MKAFLDTNVLVAASIRQHPHFIHADRALQRCLTHEDEGVVHAHSLLEFHSLVTQLPGGMAVPPGQVSALLDQGILPFVSVVALSAKGILEVERSAGELGLIGGIIYDLYHLAVAMNENVDRLLTFNVNHFQQLAPPEFRERIASP